MISVRQMRYFVAVAEELHFRKAAQKLHMSQPPVSQAMRELEEIVGSLLVERRRKTIRLTPAGEDLYANATAILSQIERAEQSAREIGHGHSQRIVVGYNSAVMLMAVTDVLRKFRCESPDVAVDLRQLAANDQIEAVRNRVLDIGFVDIGHVSLDRGSEGKISYDQAFKFELLAALPREHRFAKRKVLDCKDLAADDHIVLMRHQYPSLHDTILSVYSEAGFTANVAMFGEQMPACLSMISAGFGVGLAPDCAVSGWSSKVAFVRLKRRRYIDVFGVWRTDSQNAAIETLINIASAELAKLVRTI